MFYKIINLIKINIALNNKIVKTKLIKSDFKILNIFIKLNIVRNVKHIDKKNYIILFNSHTFFKNFKNMYKPSHPVNISLRTVINNNKNNKSIFYISTTKGILNNIEAEKNKVGGFLILKIIV